MKKRFFALVAALVLAVGFFFTYTPAAQGQLLPLALESTLQSVLSALTGILGVQLTDQRTGPYVFTTASAPQTQSTVAIPTAKKDFKMWAVPNANVTSYEIVTEVGPTSSGPWFSLMNITEASNSNRQTTSNPEPTVYFRVRSVSVNGGSGSVSVYVLGMN